MVCSLQKLFHANARKLSWNARTALVRAFTCSRTCRELFAGRARPGIRAKARQSCLVSPIRNPAFSPLAAGRACLLDTPCKCQRALNRSSSFEIPGDLEDSIRKVVKLTGQLHDLLDQRLLILHGAWLVSLCETRMTQHPTGASLRNPKELLTWSTHRRRRAGLGSFPQTPPSKSSCPTSGPPPLSSGGCSPTPEVLGAWPGRS